ncbi:MAG: polyprenyl synthetase family protein [Simkaniaceae bacterium]|nr:polyprenyl synthetase family protein [Simkaniaceae bacterium]
MSELHRIQTLFEVELNKGMDFLGPKTPLSQACEYALQSGGKRVRPLIVILVQEALGKYFFPEGALSVEFFHTASLIADDLPCMDNDDQRRNHPSLHRVVGETTALLASYALISSAYEMIARASSYINAEVGMIALKFAAECAGICGATGGQYSDLFEKRRDWEAIKWVIEQKTITLFEVAFGFGWLFGGGDPSRLDEVRKVAYHFGMAFQIGDDLSDFQHDCTQENPMNAAICLGEKKALELCLEEIKRLKIGLKALKLETKGFEELLQKLQALAILTPKSSTQSHL